MKIFAIRDSAVESYGRPYFTRSQGEAVRIFMDEAKNTESMINKHPDHFDLYYLGEYDDNTGSITPAANIERVARATDFTQE
ncbi:nonstructural protein [Apis mellifera associated microvirus 13]|nr:nonstructural protein [Apis mellifera associated microvirus 13]